jgi:lycopene cyclase CruA
MTSSVPLNDQLPPETLAHIEFLDAGWARLLRNERPPTPLSVVATAEVPLADQTVDIVYAGGGLTLLHAYAMQKQGWQTLVFDRRAIGTTHREWNISRPELQVLVDAELFTWEELTLVIARTYRRGFVRFHNPNGAAVKYDLPGVLDVAIDATALLTLARQKLEGLGGQVCEGWNFDHAWLARNGAAQGVVQMSQTGQTRKVGARLVVNGMGALSPLSLALAGDRMPLDGVCPTVGTVAEGFANGEVDPSVGEILVTIDGAKQDHQYIWEGFPAHGGQFTTYLFYYDVTAHRAHRPHSLKALFADYFALLPTYKRPGADFRHIKPVYGFIPARHHLHGTAAEQARVARGLLSVGDAAARQNPLTFTGFGSFVRHLPRATIALNELLRQGEVEAESLADLSTGQSNLNAMWVMARFLAPRGGADDVNAIFRDFTRALQEVGPDTASRFFLDQATWGEYINIMLRTAKHRPQVVAEAFQVLGARGVATWIGDLWRWRGNEKKAGMSEQ